VKVEGTNPGNAIMTVVEGNYNNAVGQRRIAYRDKRVAATCRIPYEAVITPVDPVQTVKPGAAKPAPEPEPVNKMPELSFLLKTGNKNNTVELLQAALIGNGYEIVGGADGNFGRYTKAALIQYQKDNGLVADGTAGTETFRSLLFG
jgi:peptidoglycan hydrolase-like protein with peptidoglycan-binding domain